MGACVMGTELTAFMLQLREAVKGRASQRAGGPHPDEVRSGSPAQSDISALSVYTNDFVAAAGIQSDLRSRLNVKLIAN
jgi:hypothetical protein